MVRVAYHVQMEQPTTIKRPPPRLRTYSVAEDVALDLLSGRVVTGSIDVPEGARVRSIHSDFQRMSFILVVEHESFDEVTQGMVIPYADTLAMTLQTVDSLKREAVRDFLRGGSLGVQMDTNQVPDVDERREIAKFIAGLDDGDETVDAIICLGSHQRGKPELPAPWHWVGKFAHDGDSEMWADEDGDTAEALGSSMEEQAELIWDSVEQEGGAS